MCSICQVLTAFHHCFNCDFYWLQLCSIAIIWVVYYKLPIFLKHSMKMCKGHTEVICVGFGVFA